MLQDQSRRATTDYLSILFVFLGIPTNLRKYKSERHAANLTQRNCKIFVNKTFAYTQKRHSLIKFGQPSFTWKRFINTPQSVESAIRVIRINPRN